MPKTLRLRDPESVTRLAGADGYAEAFFNGCQEASSLSVTTYIACGEPATKVVDNRDQRVYLMCDACAEHNVRNRGAQVLLELEHTWKAVGA
jgi:hypothetical protein